MERCHAPRLTISNSMTAMTTLALLVNATTVGNDLGGAEVASNQAISADHTRRRLSGDGNSDADPNARFPEERWFIDRKADENRDQVSFELASKFDLSGAEDCQSVRCIANAASGSTAAVNAVIPGKD